MIGLLLLIAPSLMGQELCAPLDQGVVSSTVGAREGMGGQEIFHKGVDLMVPAGSNVRAIASGTVVMHYPAPNGFYEGDETFGGYIVINHGLGLGLFSAYAHLSATKVRLGQYVYCGEVIGLSGNSGMSTGPHLHLETFYDPVRLLGLCASAVDTVGCAIGGQVDGSDRDTDQRDFQGAARRD